MIATEKTIHQERNDCLVSNAWNSVNLTLIKCELLTFSEIYPIIRYQILQSCSHYIKLHIASIKLAEKIPRMHWPHQSFNNGQIDLLTGDDGHCKCCVPDISPGKTKNISPKSTYKTLECSTRTTWKWLQVFRNGHQILLHLWHLWCWSC